VCSDDELLCTCSEVFLGHRRHHLFVSLGSNFLPNLVIKFFSPI
jgi:hypothetical protein